jgi:hypothetical protein
VSTPEEDVPTDDPRDAAVPCTGDPAIDDALRALGDLPSAPLADHHDRLAGAHEALHVALERSGDERGPG